MSTKRISASRLLPATEAAGRSTTPSGRLVVAYLRVSSKAQDHAAQRDSIERQATRSGDTVERWYAEKRSGRTIQRPELDRLRDDARSGRIAKLYLFRLDRLTRSGIRDTLAVIEEFRAHDVEVISVSDGFGLEGPAAEIVLAVMAWASKMERLAINERIAAARLRVEAAGGRWGRPSRFDDPLLRKARALKRAGRTIRQIAAALKVPRSTVGRALSQKVRHIS